MSGELDRAHNIANKLITELENDPRYLERFAQSSSPPPKQEAASALSPTEIAEIEKIIEEKGYKLPEIKNKRPRDEWWQTFDWWR